MGLEYPLFHQHSAFGLKKRHFLSEAYRCQEAWNRRLESPLLQKIKLDVMYHELDQKFNQEGEATAVDIDLFANAVTSEDYADELGDLIHRLRLTANTSFMLPSTPHAVIRYLLEIGRHDQLLSILNDRINYGIFPDYYCSCLLMDTFIKLEKYAAAAKVAAMEMLQEDWSDPVTTHLALYSCHMFLKKPDGIPWEEKPPEEDSGEEIKVRVKYIRNPYFDDHFDLRDSQLLVGKTLATLGLVIPDSVGCTYQLVGWGLYSKWNKLAECLQEILNNKQNVYIEGVKLLEDLLQNMKKEDGDDRETTRDKCQQLIEQLKSSGLILNDELHSAVINKVKSVVSEHEQRMIVDQCTMYEQWEKLREEILQKELEKLRKQRQLLQVKREKELLSKREEELFFFDNQEKFELIIEQSEKLAQEEEKETKKKKKVDEENYIPPEVTRKRK